MSNAPLLRLVLLLTSILVMFAARMAPAESYTVPKPVCKKVCAETQNICRKGPCAETQTVCSKGPCVETQSVPVRQVIGYEPHCTPSPIPEMPDICVDKPIYETVYKEVCVRWEEVCKEVCIRWEEICKETCIRWEEVCR